jgi:hypothetical protein
MWLNAFSFSNRIMLFTRLSLICGEIPVMLLMVLLDTLTITYGRTSDVQPLSNAYKNLITQFQNMYHHCKRSDHNIFDLTSSHFDSYCMSLTYHHEWLPPVLPLCHHTHAPACHHLPLISPEHSDDGEKESGAHNGPEYFSQEPHYIHDEMIDAPPGHHLNNMHYSEDDVSIIPKTKEIFEEQDKKENLEVRSEIKLLSPMEKVLHVWKHCNITLWSPLQDIMWTPILSNQYLLPVANLYHTHKCTHNVNGEGRGYTRANSTEFAT